MNLIKILIPIWLLLFSSFSNADLAGDLPSGNNSNDRRQDGLDQPDTNRVPYQSNVSDNDFGNRWLPLVALDLDLSRPRVTNLTPHRPQSADAKLVSYDFENQRETLVFGDSTGGYKTVFISKLEGGPGYGHLLTPHVGIGIVPVFGADAVHVRFHRNLEDSKKFSRFSRFPQQVDEFRNWQVGDSSIYSHRGGVVFFLGTATGGVGVGAIGNARGEWSVRIEKISEDQIYIKIDEASLRDYTVAAGGIVAIHSIADFNNEDEGFSFQIDLKHPKAQANYELITQGNIIEIQKVAPTAVDGVQYISSAKVRNTGNFENFLLGLPLFWNQQWNSGFSYTSVERTVSSRQDKVDVDYGIFSQSKKLTAFGTRRAYMSTFYAAQFQSRDSTSPLRGFFAKMNWEFADNNSNHWQLRQALKELIRLTGFGEVMVNIPTIENLDYLVARFELDIPQTRLNALMNLDREVLNNHEKQMYQTIESYLRDIETRDPYDLMATCGWNVEYCRYSIKKQSLKSWNGIVTALSKMKANFQSSKEFVDLTARMGEHLYANPFVFQQFLKLTQYKSFLSVEILGTHISNLTRRFEFDPIQQRLKRIQ